MAKTNNVTLFSIDAMTDEEKERLRLKPVEVNSDAELIPFNTLTKPTEQQSEPLIFNIKRPSYAPPASSYTTTTTIAPTLSYSYGNNTGYGGSPIVVGYIIYNAHKQLLILLICKYYTINCVRRMGDNRRILPSVCFESSVSNYLQRLFSRDGILITV